MRRVLQRTGFFLALVLAAACVEPYEAPPPKGGADFLVVDAFFETSSPQKLLVTLAHTIPLGSTESPKMENLGWVNLVDDQGHSTPLLNIGGGQYYMEGYFTRPENKYQIQIITEDHKEYASDFVGIKQTPPIDSINYVINGDDLEINVNAHDPSGQTRYYRWSYIETWEYQSNYASMWVLDNGLPRVREQYEDINTCWRTDTLKKIMVASTTHLSEDLVTNFNLRKIDRSSIMLSRMYSILVKQQALTQEAYDYWVNLQKVSENLGSMFDPLPGQVNGNIHSITDPAEPVIGYFSAGEVREKRIFLVPEDLPGDFADYLADFCPIDTILNEDLHLVQDPDALISAVYPLGPPVIIGYRTAPKPCIDCRKLAGGLTAKPSFWP
jgi:hypothetical protein